MSIFSFPRAQEGTSDQTPIGLARALRQIAGVTNGVLAGRLNAVAEVTLTSSAGSTTMTDARLTRNSLVVFDPTTANAAAEIYGGTMYVKDDGTNRKSGSFIITHANNGQTDRTFKALIIG
jgi:hypothetical protein